LKKTLSCNQKVKDLMVGMIGKKLMQKYFYKNRSTEESIENI
jgi:hypothetical protein